MHSNTRRYIGCGKDRFEFKLNSLGSESIGADTISLSETHFERVTLVRLDHPYYLAAFLFFGYEVVTLLSICFDDVVDGL